MTGITATSSLEIFVTGAISGGVVSFIRELSQNFDTKGITTWNGILVGSILSGSVGDIVGSLMTNMFSSEAKSLFLAVRIASVVIALIGVLSPVLEFFNHYTFQSWHKVRNLKLGFFYSFIFLSLVAAFAFSIGFMIKRG